MWDRKRGRHLLDKGENSARGTRREVSYWRSTNGNGRYDKERIKSSDITKFRVSVISHYHSDPTFEGSSGIAAKHRDLVNGRNYGDIGGEDSAKDEGAKRIYERTE